MNPRKPKQSKARLYSLEWDVLKAVRSIEEYESKYGTYIPLSYRALSSIYKGTLLPAIYFKKISPVQKFGVTFTITLTNEQDEVGTVEHGIKISEPMTIRQFFNGYEDCYTHHGNGLKTKGWKGAKDFWLDLLAKEYPNCEIYAASAKANCLVR